VGLELLCELDEPLDEERLELALLDERLLDEEL